MKKAILLISMAIMLCISGLTMAFAQDLPSAKKDSINADKAAKPVFYDAAAPAEAPKNNSSSTYVMIAGAVLVVGVGGYFLMRKKKN